MTRGYSPLASPSWQPAPSRLRRDSSCGAPGAILHYGRSELWTRYGLRDLHYERRIGRDRAVGATKCRSTSPSGTTTIPSGLAVGR